GGQRHAGDRVAADAAVAVVAAHAVRGHDGVDARAIRRGHVRDDQVLVAGEPDVAGVYVRDLAHAAEPACFVAVQQAAGFHLQGEVPAAVVAFDPAVAV